MVSVCRQAAQSAFNTGYMKGFTNYHKIHIIIVVVFIVYIILGTLYHLLNYVSDDPKNDLFSRIVLAAAKMAVIVSYVIAIALSGQVAYWVWT